MSEDRVNDAGNHNETKEEKLVSTGTGLVPEQAKAPPAEVPDQALIAAQKQAYGSADPDFLTGLAVQINNSGIRALSDNEFKYKVSVIKGAEPRNPFEALIALQMVGTHDAIMRAQRNFLRAENVMQQDSAGRILHKLTRSFLDQKNALERNRTGGDQKVTVQHVSVSDGGQAIVGHVTQTPPANAADRPAADSPLTATETKSDPMPAEGDKGYVARVRSRSKINGQ
jgi:hypothetical protein